MLEDFGYETATEDEEEAKKLFQDQLRSAEIFELHLVNYFDEDYRNLNYTWQIDSITKSHMEFNLTFESPGNISSREKADQLRIVFKKTQRFLRPQDENLASIPDGYVLNITLSPQIANDEFVFLQKLQTSFTSIVVSNLIATFVIEAPL